MTCSFFTVDVFTDQAFQGAQIAVVPDASELSAEQMQQYAQEFNLWRSVFVTSAVNEDKARKLKVFNSKKEFDFGGHATLAAIHALAETGQLSLEEGSNEFILQENSGDVHCNVDMQAGKAVFQQFTSDTQIEIDRFTPRLDELASFLSVKPYHFEVSGFQPLLVASHLPYLFVPVDNYATLSSIQFDYNAWTASTAPATFANAIFLFSVSQNQGELHFHCRLVGPNFGIHEDPPIGAAMPAFAAYLSQFSVGQNLPLSFVAERGIYAGRKSEVYVDVISVSDSAVRVKIGGQAVLMSKGEVLV